MDLLRAFVNLILLPPGLQLLLAGAALLLARRHARLALGLLGIAVGSLLLLSMPLVSNGLTRATGPFVPYEGGGSPQAIVVLAAEWRVAPEYGGVGVGPRTLERLRLGAHWARHSGLPVLLSGGQGEPGDPRALAELMRHAWEEEFGLPVRWIEGQSRNTRENARESVRLLRAAGIERVLLVTHYVHMGRALADFADAGITALPAPTGFPRSEYPGAAAALWPRAQCLEESTVALHELLGMAGRALGAPV
jgi:uncharacterized SAM-binding protein YcdF (DUF218 family)